MKIDKDKWYSDYSGSHQKIFDYGLSEAHVFRYVLAVFDDSNVLSGYISVDELDRESAYLPYGGMFMNHQGVGLATDSFGLCLGELKKDYKRVGFLTKTINKKMINLGHKLGFEIVGMRMEHGVPCVEMLLDFGG